MFLEKTKNLLFNPPPHVTRPNLTLQKRFTLKKLSSNSDLFMKPFDKGSGICLMDTSIYISKIKEHLADPSTYKQLSSEPNEAIRNDVFSTLFFNNNYRINDVTRYHLMPPKPARTPLFYCFLKVHKPNIPLRPTVSACDSPIDQFSNYVTYSLQPLVETLPSYILDSKHFLQLLESLRLCQRTLF